MTATPSASLGQRPHDVARTLSAQHKRWAITEPRSHVHPVVTEAAGRDVQVIRDDGGILHVERVAP